MQLAKQKFESRMEQQQLSGHQKVPHRQDHSLENNTPPPKNKDNTLQHNYPTLPEAIFEIPDSPKEQRQERKQQVLTDVRKQSDQVKVTEPNHEEGSTLEKDPGDNNGDNSKTEQISNHDESADGSEESIEVSESNISNDEDTVTTSEDSLTICHPRET